MTTYVYRECSYELVQVLRSEGPSRVLTEVWRNVRMRVYKMSMAMAKGRVSADELVINNIFLGKI